MTPIARAIVLALVTVTMGLGIRLNTFTPWGTDQASYIESATRWAEGRPFMPLPLREWAPWTANPFVALPFGFALGAAPGTDAGMYPSGLPIAMAALLKIGGELAPYVLPALAAGLLVWSVASVATTAAGPWAGVLAATLVAASPVTLAYAAQPMSDVPAAALWFFALTSSLRRTPSSAVAAGVATAAAVTIRPNLAPLALALVAVLVTGRGASTYWRQRATLVFTFGLTAAIGPALVLWSNAVLYGHPLLSGYGSAGGYFGLEYVRTSAVVYPWLLVQVHSPAVFAGLLAVPLVHRAWRGVVHAERVTIIWACAVLVVINFALYVAYIPYDDANFARLFLPALAALFVLLAVLAVAVFERTPSRVARLLVLTIPVVVAAYPGRYLTFAVTNAGRQQRVRVMGHYLRESAPANAAFLTSLQGGALYHYTHAPVVRLDQLPADALDAVVRDLERHGYHPLIVLDADMEVPVLATRFGGSTYARLDWPPTAMFRDDEGAIALLDTRRREAYREGERWAVDVVRNR